MCDKGARKTHRALARDRMEPGKESSLRKTDLIWSQSHVENGTYLVQLNSKSNTYTAKSIYEWSEIKVCLSRFADFYEMIKENTLVIATISIPSSSLTPRKENKKDTSHSHLKNFLAHCC